MPKFSKKEALKFGWDGAINNVGFLVVALLGSWVAILIPNALAGYLSEQASFGSLLFSILAMAVGIVVNIGFIRLSLKIVNGEKPTVNDFRPDNKTFWNFVGAAIIAGILGFVGFILLIIPGIIVTIMFQFYAYFVVEKGLGPITALKASAAATKGSRWNLFGLMLLEILVVILGVLALGVGLFIAIPVTFLANAWVYKRLTSMASDTVAPAAVAPAIPSA